MWGSKTGLPVSILDEDIHVDMQSTISRQEDHDAQFSDTDYLIASINLATIAGEIITKIYSKKKYNETFLHRVQKLLKALKTWVETLPGHLRLNSDDTSFNQKHITSLHLSFNQVSQIHSSIKEWKPDDRKVPHSRDSAHSSPCPYPTEQR
jgi:hypothetical protein